jgi:hypothetical protein
MGGPDAFADSWATGQGAAKQQGVSESFTGKAEQDSATVQSVG